MFDSLVIECPKRAGHLQTGWEGFFPYYAGYPENFARALLKSATLPKHALVLDPWNGSGTTTFSASQLGLESQGFDINPAMIVIARARLLPTSEADSLEPLARDTVKNVRADPRALKSCDPLLWWFKQPTAALIRALERRIRRQLVGDHMLTPDGVKLDHISGFAATFYVALFALCREMLVPFRSSNPAWLRKPKVGDALLEPDRDTILSGFVMNVRSMAAALGERRRSTHGNDHAVAEVQVADTASIALPKASVDLVLTSPPYCTRIDYSAATRIELAILDPIIDLSMEDLSRQMIGSTRVPGYTIAVDQAWGATCERFLAAVKTHPSKASSGYYYKTHLDYFRKMSLSLDNLVIALKPAAAAILVVQDSYYKDIHNDLPAITSEMAEAKGLRIRRRVDFEIKRSMSGINPRTRIYRRPAGGSEAVLCFEKV